MIDKYTDKFTYVDSDWLRESGVLQEVNRQFFHPLGLAMQVGWCRHDGDNPHAPEDCTWPNMSYIGVLDYRSDPEGMFFDLKAEGEPEDSIAKARSVQTMLYSKLPAREAWAKDNDEHVSAEGVQLLTYVKHEGSN